MSAPTARYVLTADHLVEANMRAFADGIAATRKRYLVYAALLAALFGVQVALDRGSDGAFAWFSGWMAVAFVALVAFYPALMRRRFRRLAAGRTDVGRTVTWRALPEMLEAEVSGQSQTRLHLSSLVGVETEAEGLLVVQQPRQASWIPADAFDSPAERDAFERVVLAGAPLPDPAL